MKVKQPALSLFPIKMLAKLEGTLSATQQNKVQSQNPHKQWTNNKQ